MRVFVLLTTFLISALTAHAQWNPQWVHQNPYPTGSLLSDVWYQSETRIHCVGDAGSIFYSSDGGVNWHTERSGTTRDLYGLCFTSNNNGYAVGAGGSILRTTDGGQSWIGVANSATVDLRSIRFVGMQTGLIVGKAGTYLTTVDGGATWSLASIPGVTESLYGIDMRSANRWIVVGENNTIMVTTNAGVTWKRAFVSQPTAGSTLHAVAFTNDDVGVAVGVGTALFTTDGGANWRQGIRNSLGDLLDLALTANGTWIAIGSGGNIIQTSDGENWSQIISPSNRSLYGISLLDADRGVVIGAGGLVLNTSNGGNAWDVRSFGYTTDLLNVSFSDKLRGMATGYQGGTYRTTDGGRTWVQSIIGVQTQWPTSISFRDRYTGLLGNIDGILRTTDGGVTWTRVSSRELVKKVVIKDTYALAVNERGVILKSTDAGETWKEQISNTSERLEDIALIDDQYHVVVGQSNIHVTTNGGAQWINRGNFGSRNFTGVSFTDHDNGWIVTKYDESLLRTTDGGQTFTRSIVSGRHNDILFTDANKGWIVGDTGVILHTTDGGLSWNPQLSGTRSDLYGIHFSGPEYGWVVGKDGVILSTIDVRTGPSIAMTISAPATVNWNRSTRAHEPVRVTAIVTNSGGRPAGESMYTLSIDTTVFELVSPATLVQAGDPSELLHGTSDTLVWDLRAKVLTAVDSLPICVMGSWDNHPEVTACTMTRVAEAEPTLSCSLTMPTITWDGAARRYAPRPAPVRVTVRNEGPVAAENVALRAAVPPQMVLTDAAGMPLQAQEQRLDVGSLPIGVAVDTTVWVMHANSTIPLTYPFTLDVLHRDVIVGGCKDSIAIPMVGPIVDVQILGPVSVVWNRSTGGYNPDTLRVTMRARNTGGLPSTASRYRLQFDAQYFDIAAGTEVQVGDPVDLAPGAEAVHMWMLVPKLRASLDSTEICVLATYANHPDVRSCMTVRVGAVMPAVQCSLDVPTVRWNVDEKRYDPIPATVTLSVTNNGPVAIETIDAVLTIAPAGGLTFTTGGPFMQRVALGPIAIGATATTTVQVRHDTTFVRRSYDIRSQLVLRGVNLADCTAEVVIPAANSRPVIIPGGSLRLCEGDTVDLDAGAHAAYRWSTGDTTRHITVRGAGSFTVDVPDGQGGWLTSEPVVTVAVQTPRPTLTIIGSTRFCKGDSVIVDAGAGYATYNWSTGERTRSIVVKTTAMVACTVTTPEGCRGWSDTLFVTQLPGIDTSVTVIEDNRAYLAYPAGYRYQWYKDLQVLKDSVSQFLYPSKTGWYAVEIINQDGCRKMSGYYFHRVPGDTIIYSAEPTSTPTAIEISAYPDPVTDQVTISLRGVLDQVTDLRIVDMLGRTVHAHADVRALRAGGVVVSMAGQSPGTYMILVSTPRSVQVRRIIKR